MSTLVHPGAFVDPAAKLGAHVEIGPGAWIGPNVVVGDGSRIDSCARLDGWTRIGAHCHIHHGAVVGTAPQDLKYVAGPPSYVEVGDHSVLREYVTVNRATEPEASTRIGAHCLLMAYSHVAHNCEIGDHAVVANLVQFAGYVVIEEWAILGGGTLVHQFVRVGCHAFVGGMSRVSQDIAPYVKCSGIPPHNAGINAVGLARRGFSDTTRQAIDRAYRILFRDGLTVTEAVARMRAEWPGLPEVERLARFAETSVRGLTR
jgi:UDP-N-acetylglucosamine acyltransferase